MMPACPTVFHAVPSQMSTAKDSTRCPRVMSSWSTTRSNATGCGDSTTTSPECASPAGLHAEVSSSSVGAEPPDGSSRLVP